MQRKGKPGKFWRQGEPYVWACGAALSLILLMTGIIFYVVFTSGPPVFWAKAVTRASLKSGGVIAGQIMQSELNPATGEKRLQFRLGNRDLYGLDFRWVESGDITASEQPHDAVVIERREYGNFIGFLKDDHWQELKAALADGNDSSKGVALFTDAGGREKEIRLTDIVRLYRPNQMTVADKISLYLDKCWELLTDEPRESNTEGGLFPAIFGTVMMIFLMSILSFPLGVITGIYLREYAKDGFLLRFVRIAVNNLAGIPSIVYGIFGLGFFVYGLGSTIDAIFFADRLPQPTFGTGGILWASLTLGLLTVPVVIVATEEALGAIPKGIREASLALGATKFQTLTRLLVPMASPGIMTGFVLAMARAAGEVAPLMITGVVKLAPSLAIDRTFPFVHLDRKFMHLGFHIYDIGFQSPNVEAAKPMVYVTTLLLLLIVIVMTSAAISLRNKMRKRYSLKEV